jgi:hypothetical protein
MVALFINVFCLALRRREVGKNVCARTVNDSTDAGVVERTRQTAIGRNRIYVVCLGGEPMPIGSYVKVSALPGTAMVEEGWYVWKIKDYATHQVISTKRPCGQAHLRFSESQSFPFCGGTAAKPT